MQSAWKILIGFGIFLVVLSFGVDTTVASGGGRVYNTGLQQERQNIMILGCFMFLAGIVLYAVRKMKQTPEQDAAENIATDATKMKVNWEVHLLAAEVGQAGRDFKELWLLAWGKVRRLHVFVVGIVVVNLSMVFPIHLVIDYPDGVYTRFPTRLLIGSNEPLIVGRLFLEVILELIVFGFLYKVARK